MDRMDYLNRDSFFTGVSEGVIGYDRIIKMLNVRDNNLVIDEKGIYSVEKFIIARRLMYWAVYLHKTVLSAEVQMVNILRRAKELSLKGTDLFTTSGLKKFLRADFSLKNFEENESLLDSFALLDYDVVASIKEWTNHQDKILSLLCIGMVNRKLFRIEMSNKPFETKAQQEIREKIKTHFRIDDAECNYLITSGEAVNHAYDSTHEKINILYKNGEVKDITEASDLMNISALSVPVVKYYLCSIRF
jgi:HD superfamily phosphohydrolase